ncbi:hypothetical protein BO83DRAFT_69293 [Aspergillus eucalypticola CBS 122712]|uniref:Uncharacterized protein n=1 Tax=Aspergillus eucalypticola (strain CBS 122712 / IBT 29274) TaxID=1448314 RepID=A0A317V8W7_ASPEC|nr:uncharacterized protein BO83DRAFT_69293 [Aspergillus eucalypticola CBS 122712]PWY69292.1 hypothetical protein BO83DRAFT_69293 [Aspergillus eucalypticola CBS 122712]
MIDKPSGPPYKYCVWYWEEAYPTLDSFSLSDQSINPSLRLWNQFLSIAYSWTTYYHLVLVSEEMPHQAGLMYQRDPGHTSCIGGRTVVTCRSCAGNAPRNSVCSSCNGRGFNVFICPHCNPAAAAAAFKGSAGTSQGTTPNSSVPASPSSLSRSSSTLSSDTRPIGNGRRSGDSDESSSGGHVGAGTNSPRTV